MVNLKHLYFAPRIADPLATTIFKKCTFQLESFTWVGEGCQEALLNHFLPTQHRLSHLVITSDSESKRVTPALPGDLCPSLTSIVCPLSDFVSISAGRHITALDICNAGSRRSLRVDLMEEAERRAYTAGLMKIQYLCLSSLSTFQKSTIGITFQCLTMLEVYGWKIIEQVGFKYMCNLYLHRAILTNSTRFWTAT